MQIVFHIGVHHTDDGLVLQNLAANAPLLASRGVLVPEPDSYRAILNDSLQKLRGEPASAQTQDAILDTILEDAEGDRVIFSDENFPCRPAVIFNDQSFYKRLGLRIPWLRNLFPDFEVTIAMGLRDPASLVPEVYGAMRDRPPFPDFMDGISLASLSWLQVITELRQALPDTPLLIWCNEDTPLIWPEIMQALTAHGADVELSGMDVLLSQIMTEAGLARMKQYLAANPPRDVVHRRRITAAFLDKFAKDDAMEEEVDLDGWTIDIMDDLSNRYEYEVDTIAAMPGVKFLLP